ncbi:hypothetical protein D1BOALGB6SA_6484 [Olavius sp. associated proteobacterium Delta 1]|nr:hypothetical protein D1BOALGB6SA_6484 [Olavius sp. associated proteobacterium Delta 1]
MKNTTRLKIIISCAGLLILLARLIWPMIKIDAISLGLIIVAILPWLSSLIESAEFPGGWKIKFHDMERAGAKITAEEEIPSTTSTTTTTTTTLPPEALESKTNQPFFDVRDRDPNLALVGLRIEIEKRIRAMAKIEGLDTNQPLSKLLRELNHRGVLTQMVFSGLQDIVSAGNQAAHGAKVEPSVTDWAFHIGTSILAAMDRKIEAYRYHIERVG